MQVERNVFFILSSWKSLSCKKHREASVCDLAYLLQVRDLLATGSEGADLELQKTATGFIIPGLTKVSVTSAEQITQVMAKGYETRIVACHDINAHSSRSHALLIVEVWPWDTSLVWCYCLQSFVKPFVHISTVARGIQQLRRSEACFEIAQALPSYAMSRELFSCHNVANCEARATGDTSGCDAIHTWPRTEEIELGYEVIGEHVFRIQWNVAGIPWS